MAEPSSLKVVLVLGMHRSGTSVITRSLKLLGVELGDDLFPAAADNPRGFWEDNECLALNESLLAHLGSAYDRLGMAWPEDRQDPFIVDWTGRAAGVLTRRTERFQRWGFKDPRTCRLLGYWMPALQAAGLKPGFVIALRNPLSVAASLKARQGMEAVHSHYLWQQHLVQAVLGAQGHPTVVVDYDRIVDDPVGQVRRVAAALGLTPPPEDGPELRAFTESFLSVELRHDRADLRRLERDSEVPADVVKAFGFLQSAAEDKVDPGSPAFHEAFRVFEAHLRDNESLLNYATALEDTRRDLGFRLAAAEAELGRPFLARSMDRVAHGVWRRLPLTTGQRGAVKTFLARRSGRAGQGLVIQRAAPAPLPAALLPRPGLVLVVHDAHPHGAQSIGLALARGFGDLGRPVALLCLGPGALKGAMAQAGEFHDLEGLDLNGPGVRRLAHDLRRRGYEKAIVNSCASGAILPALRGAGIACTTLVHELPHLVRAKGLEAQAQLVLGRSNQVVFPADVVRRGFEVFGPMKEGQARVRPQGLWKANPHLAGGRRLARRLLRDELGLSPDALVVLGVGYADYRKGIDHFVDVGLRLARAGSSAHFVWVGHWECPDPSVFIRDRAAGIPGGDRIHAPGFRVDPALYYAGADVFALTSREDPFPMVVLEALESGLPVVAFAGSGGANALLDDGAGINVPMADEAAFALAVRGLLDDPEERRRLGGVGARLVAEQFAFLPYLTDLDPFNRSTAG